MYNTFKTGGLALGVSVTSPAAWAVCQPDGQDAARSNVNSWRTNIPARIGCPNGRGIMVDQFDCAEGYFDVSTCPESDGATSFVVRYAAGVDDPEPRQTAGKFSEETCANMPDWLKLGAQDRLQATRDLVDDDFDLDDPDFPDPDAEEPFTHDMIQIYPWAD